MEKQEILDILEKFDLNDYEARTYTALMTLGPAKAGDISKEAKVPQSKIYLVLENLMEKQLVEVFGGRPKEFKAITPGIALRNFLDEKEKDLMALREKVETLSDVIKNIEPREETIEGIWIKKGEKWVEFFNRLSEMLDRCEKYAFAITRDFSYTSRLTQTVKKCVRKKIDFRIIGLGEINEANYRRAKWYHEYGVPIRIFEAQIHPRILVIDGKEVFIRLDHDPFKRQFSFQSIWSQDSSLVKVFDNYVKNLWKQSKAVDFSKLKFQ